MKAVVYTGDNSAEYKDVDSPVVRDGQTRVDLSFFKAVADGHWRRRPEQAFTSMFESGK